MRSRTAGLLFCSLLLAACGGDAPAPRQEQKQEQQQENVWKDQTDTLDRARSVEQTLQEDAEQKRKQLQEQED